ncbi:hypothetical protein WHU00_03970 [Escherichia coli]|uniref:hypothetical protein n=1 Tax=Escherichia coli TaxID=562 RepID=UPI0030CF47AC
MIDEKKSGREDLHRLSLLDATLKRRIQPGLSFCRPDKTLKRRIRHKADYFLISYSGV